MQVTESSFEDLFIFQPTSHADSRGAFSEVLRMDLLAAKGIAPIFVQMNHSTSWKNVLRGLHFQWDKPLGKYIRVIAGSAFMVAVDIRKHSKTLGQAFTGEMSRGNRTCLWVPPGFATGFCVMGDTAEVEYLYTAYYNAKGESNIRWNDPALRIDWPLQDPVISERDRKAGTLAEWLARPESDVF